MREIHFTLPYLTPTLNGPKGLLRMHWAAKKRLCVQMSKDVFHLAMAQRPKTPMEKVSIKIRRLQRSPPVPDFDNFIGGLKPLLDVLQPVTDRRSFGLGFILDDSESCIVETYYLAEVDRAAGPATQVWIREVE